MQAGTDYSIKVLAECGEQLYTMGTVITQKEAVPKLPNSKSYTSPRFSHVQSYREENNNNNKKLKPETEEICAEE